jgi:asparagine synthase (glutamine-hydrolysing)
VQTGKGAAAAEVPGDGWIRLVRTDGAVHLDGSARATLGHRIPRPETPDDGVFASWHWDGETLRVENDRYGAYPLFYHASDEQVLVSPSLVRILELGAPRELDEDALAAFLALGYYLADDTVFRSIRRLPPDARLHWSATGWSLDSGERPIYRFESLSRPAIIDGVIERFRASMARRLEGADDCVMPVSGGRDSRHILLELHAQGHAPRLAVTAHKYPHENDWDAEYAARLCAAIGQPHRVLPPPGGLVRAEAAKNTLAHFAADEHAWYLPVAEALAGGTHTYDGLGGSTFLARPQALRIPLRSAFEAGPAQAARHMIKTEGGEARFSGLVAPAMRQALSVERAAARIERELLRHSASSDPLASFFARNRSMNELPLAPYSMARVPTVYVPFMDHDMHGFLTAIPTASVDEELHGEMLARAYPHAARIPYAPGGLPKAYPSRWVRRTSADLARLLLGSRGTLVDRGSLLRRAIAGAARADDWPVRARRAALLTYLVQLERLEATGRI